MTCEKCLRKVVCPHLKNNYAEKCQYYMCEDEWRRINPQRQKNEGKRKTIGQIIKEKRKGKGLILEELSKMLGVSVQTASYWERDKQLPHLFNIWDLADLFECSLDELCGRTLDK